MNSRPLAEAFGPGRLEPVPVTRHIPARRVADAPGGALAERLSRAVLEIAGEVPASDEGASRDPERRARMIAAESSNRAAVAAGTLALPPGPLGWLTIVPELLAIWRIQRQMVADLAAVYGVSHRLTRSQMLYCLFRHAAAQALRDVGVQVGARMLSREVPRRALERMARRIGFSISQRLAGRGLARWLPVAGAIGVGAYAWYDTGQVARTAMQLFRAEAAVRNGPDEPPDAAARG